MGARPFIAPPNYKIPQKPVRYARGVRCQVCGERVSVTASQQKPAFCTRACAEVHWGVVTPEVAAKVKRRAEIAAASARKSNAFTMKRRHAERRIAEGKARPGDIELVERCLK
jgi:endogenous inhibitor of DNA gyrase (YacG/DUF329 family)